MKTYTYECFADTLSFAESLGWTEPLDLTDLSGETWTPAATDAMEDSAIEFIEEKGHHVEYPE